MASEFNMAVVLMNESSGSDTTTSKVTLLNSSQNPTERLAADDVDHNRLQVYLLMAMLIIFAVVGSFGNTFVLYGFSKMLRQNLTSTVFILTLAGTDLLTCVVIMPFTVYMEYTGFRKQSDIACKLYHFFITSTVPYSIFMMVAIAVDRYLCICRPFLHFMNLRKAKIVVIVLAVWAVLLGLIISLFYGVYVSVSTTTHAILPILNQTDYDYNGTFLFLPDNSTFVETNITRDHVQSSGECERNYLIFSKEFQTVIQYFYLSLFVIAVVIVGILYGCIFRAVTKRRKKTQKIRSTNSVVYNCNGNSSRRESVFTQLTQRKRRSSTQESTKRNSRRSERAFVANFRTALTLFIVTVAFIILFLPGWIMAFRLVTFNYFLYYLHLLHNVVNPFIYAFMNETFRRVLRKLFNCGPAPAQKPVIGVVSQTTC